MNWTTTFIIGAVVALVFILKRVSQISVKDARKHLENGALVIDVRSPDEFNSGHLPDAINLPLGKVKNLIPQRVTNRNRVLLLHCQSGMRSDVAKKQLRSLGYANTFNLGSLRRAAKIVSGK